MAFRHLIRRATPDLDRRWVIGGIIVILLVVAATFVRWGGPQAPLELVALGPAGEFGEAVELPADWVETSTTTPDAVARVPLVLGVRNPGVRPQMPDRLDLSLPLRYRLTTAREEALEPRIEAGSPLLTYTLRPRFEPIEPQTLPALLPGHDTLWLEVVVPSYYCVAVADSIPEFVPAPAPPLETLASLRVFYAFSGGDLPARQTGTIDVALDPAAIPPTETPEMQSFPMETDPEAALPDLGELSYEGSRRSRCGEPDSPMELLSNVWATEEGARVIALEYGGRVRKHLYDLDGDGVIDRESWDPTGDGRLTATRRARMPTPDFLLPVEPTRYDMARIDSLPPDSQAALNPFRRAMPGPGAPPMGGAAAGDTADEDVEDADPAPQQGPAGPLGRPIPTDGG